ncbi:hypothetical protein [Demequina iriomotensis]|uniref:hypothetical protein n=1 Tax=Demequina iriomotensis TaxID=1536641 RepID=UPI000784F443|nr:hypothetical protein [Demequina iriomotensis]
MGEHPAEVYWQRRIVLAVAIVVVLLVGRLIWSAVASGAEPSGDPTGSPEPTVTETADDAAAAGDDATDGGAAVEEIASSTEPTDGSTEPAAQITACGQGDIEVALGDKAQVGADQVSFDVTLTQTGDEACVLDAGAGDSALLITSGDTRIWSSKDCGATAALADKEWLLDSGKSKTFQVSWPRTWSSEGCGNPSSTAPQPGMYWAQLTFQGQTAERVQFELS